MDFNTIKENLRNHSFRTMRQFLTNVELVFDNCLIYNGEHSDVGKGCKEVQEEYYKMCETLNVGFYLTEQVDEEEV